MKKLSIFLLVMGVLSAPLAARDLDSETSIRGDYLEARTAEVFVGHCLANSETGLVGQEAVMGWRVSEGSWDGVELGGLSVMAVVMGADTLGDVALSPVVGRSLILVQEGATDEQESALVSLVRSMAGPLVERVVGIERAPIEAETDLEHGMRAIRAGEIAAVEVRPRRHEDGLCGNEDVYYPPLVELDHAHPAFTLRHEYLGAELGTNWRSPGKSSSYVGHFAR